MSCPEQETIELYISGKLTEADQAEFKKHLDTCSDCKSKIADARKNESLLMELRTFLKDDANSTRHSSAAVETLDSAQKLLGERYRVIRRVGEGSAGQVFQVVDTVLERLVAVKFLVKVSPDEGEKEERWREARLMSKLNHPNIAQIYEIGESDNHKFIVMEWVDGLALTEAWKGLNLQQKLRLYLEVLDAIAVAHRRGIIHRDIKPSNILVTSELRAKVLDFGIAVESGSLEGIERRLYRGTPAYSAPEQLLPPVKISTSTDVFALGILLYQLLTDNLPFPQTDPRELYHAIRAEYPELPTAVQAKVPISLQNICLTALEKNPHHRYPNALALADDINRYLRGEKVWSKPSFLMDKIQQEVFYHRQKLEVWRDNELITQKEFDRLANIYERMISPPDPSIIEARKLSFSQVCLYLGGWIAVLGSFVLFYKTWENIPIYWRPTPAIIATAVMSIFGLKMWSGKESRLAVGYLATANLLIPITILLTLGQWEIFSPANYSWGQESIAEALKEVQSYLIVGNRQLYVSSCSWLVFSLIFLRITRSSIFVLFSIIAFLACLTTCYVIAGMIGYPDAAPWDPDIIGGRYLFSGIGLFIFGTILDRRKFTSYAWPVCVVGMALIVVPLSIIALSENTLFGWVWAKPDGINQTEKVALSFACNGLFYLMLATGCRLLGTRLQRQFAQSLNWLGPLHILGPLRVLDVKFLSVSDTHQVVYRTLLPIASFAFVFASVPKQMKSFFFSGLGGIAASVHKFTVEHLDKFFAWPVSLITTGIVWMFVSWLIPRWKGGMALRRKD